MIVTKLQYSINIAFIIGTLVTGQGQLRAAPASTG